MLLHNQRAPSSRPGSANRQCLQLASPLSCSHTVSRAKSRRFHGSRPVRSCGTFDLIAVSNLCVDVVLKVDQLPPLGSIDRRQLLADETAALADTADRSTWEVGGSCNVAIAAARLGLAVATCGNLPADVYGRFLSETLQVCLPPKPSVQEQLYMACRSIL